MPSRWRLSPLKDMSIRWRLTLLNALIIGVILLTLAASATWLWRGDLITRVKNTTERQGEAAVEI